MAREPLRVEVHAPGKPVRVVGAEDELTAPGILANPVPVRALVDTNAATVAATVDAVFAD